LLYVKQMYSIREVLE